MFILSFNKISKKDTKIAGGKGASLGEMTNAGIPVPPGFVVLASAFERFLEKTDLNIEVAHWLSKLNPEDMESIEEVSEVLQSLILKAKMPTDIKTEILKEFKKLKTKLVAVRSSATAEDSKVDSWAGELESYLNTDEKNLLKNVQRCWASLYTPRALFYGCERKFYKPLGSTQGIKKLPVSVAVVVQSMVQSEAAGVCFSVHPVTKDRNQMIIEAVWGLGEAIVGGMVTPDSYVVDKRDFSILDINISEQEKMISKSASKEMTAVPKNKKSKQKILGKEIIELAKLCVKIEKHYKAPQDIEWASLQIARGKGQMAKRRFFIVQSRPITTL